MAELEIKATPRMRMRISLIVIVAIVISSSEMYLLAGGAGDLFDRKTVLTTYMPDAAGVDTESEVRLNGIHIGDVSKIELSGSLEPSRVVRADLRVLTRYLKYIPADSRTAVNADTIVDYKFIEIDEGKSPEPMPENGVLQSQPAAQETDRTDLIAALQERLSRIDSILADLSTPGSPTGRFVAGSGIYDGVLAGVTLAQSTLHAFLNPQSALGQAIYSEESYNRGHDALVRVDNMLAAIQNGEGTAGHLFATQEQYDEYLRKVADLRSSLARAKAGSLLADDAAWTNAVRMLKATNAKLASLNAGEGAAGRLLTSQQLYEELNGEVRKLQQILGDFDANPQKYLRIKMP